MNEVSLFRLYLLRSLYLFIAAGLGRFVWPTLVDGSRHWDVPQGEVYCMLVAFSLLCVLGLRYPLQMLPVLLWEVIWKTLWLILIPLPQWRAGHIDEAIKPSIVAVSLVVLVYIAIPWRYVYFNYVKFPATRWR